MRWIFLLLTIAPTCAAQYTLVGCASSTKNYVVGAKLPPSGLFLRDPETGWKHVGYNHPWLLTAAGSTGEMFIAGGNGLIRARDGGKQWRILSGSDVTELRDLDMAHGAIYFAHSAGIRVTRDGGSTFREIGGGLRRQYTEAIRAHPGKPGVLLAGGEEGIFRSEDDGKTWRLAGAAGHPILRIEGSPHDPCLWLAGTERGGFFVSRDCGVSFESLGNLGVGFNSYDIAFDALEPKRVAVATWGPGVAVSEDNGATWQFRNSGLPSREISSVVFDPVRQGRLFAAVHDAGVYRSDDAGLTWTKDGLDDTHVNRLRFVREVGQ
jgi:photosystem II stability/assembly factor-like uncharacterized protein